MKLEGKGQCFHVLHIILFGVHVNPQRGWEGGGKGEVWDFIKNPKNCQR